MDHTDQHFLTTLRGLLGPNRREIDLRVNGQNTIQALCSNAEQLQEVRDIIIGDYASRSLAFELLGSSSSKPRCALVVDCPKNFSENWSYPVLTVPTSDERCTVVAASDVDLLKQFAEGLMASNRLQEILRGAKGAYEIPVQEWFREHIQPGWTCLDVGCHVGILSFALGQCVGPSGHVYSFDAFEQNAKDVNYNAAFLGLEKQVKAQWCAITDGSSETVRLFSGRHQWSAEWNLRGVDVEGKKSETSLEVPARSLDGLFPTEKVDFVKIDVEGAATGVIRGMRSILARCAPQLFIEYHGADEDEGMQLLSDQGYTFIDLSSRRPILDGKYSYHVIGTRKK